MADLIRAAMLGFSIGVLLAVVGAVDAEGQERNSAASYIGLCHKLFPCAPALKVFDDLEVKRVGWLAVTFGKRCPCARRFLALPGKKVARIHLVNGTCFGERGRVCSKGEFFYQESIRSADLKLKRKAPSMLKRYRKALRVTEGHIKAADADTTILLSLCLECPLSNRARRAMMEVAQEVFPGVGLVDSVLTQKCLSGLICEKHGDRARVPVNGVADTDGDDFLEMDVADYLERNRHAVFTGLWTARFNLLGTGRVFVPPLRRTTRPTPSDFRELRRWLVYSPGL